MTGTNAQGDAFGTEGTAIGADFEWAVRSGALPVDASLLTRRVFFSVGASFFHSSPASMQQTKWFDRLMMVVRHPWWSIPTKGAGVRRARVLAMSAVVTAALVLVMGVGPAAAAFSDVKPTDWFVTAVDQLAAKGVVQGGTDGRFRPYETVTRAQFAAMLARAVKPPAATTEPFTDVYGSDWFYGPVASLYHAGLIAGTSATSYSPASGLARQQAATLIVRAVGYQQSKETTPTVDLTLTDQQVESWLGGFKDRGFISQAHRFGMANSVRLSIVEGYADGRFYPFFTITRAQAAGMIYRGLFTPLAPKTTPPPTVPAEASYPVLSIGSNSPLVGWLEEKLRSLHYVPGAVNTTYDEATKDAVMAFQKVERLSRDGQAGPQVWCRIFVAQVLGPARRRRQPSRNGSQPTGAPDGQQRASLEDPARRHRTAGWLTPPGHYRIIRKMPWWREQPGLAVQALLLQWRDRHSWGRTRCRFTRPATAVCGCRAGRRMRSIRSCRSACRWTSTTKSERLEAGRETLESPPVLRPPGGEVSLRG